MTFHEEEGRMPGLTRTPSHAGLTMLATLGALGAAIGVGLGAFGAHGLRQILSAEMLAVFETAVRYQMYHAGAMLLAALGGLILQGIQRRFLIAGWLFGGGIILFSGSLYLLSIAGARWAGAVTPLGGLLFIAGWTVLATAFFSRRGGSPSGRL